MRRAILLAMLAVVLLCGRVAQGDYLYSSNDPSISVHGSNHFVTGDGNVTIDSVSGLAWLDVTLTSNLSYNQVVAQLGTGGYFSRYRIAGTTEIESLLTHAGFPNPGGGSYYVNATDVAAFQSLFGYQSLNTFTRRPETHIFAVQRMSGVDFGIGYPPQGALYPSLDWLSRDYDNSEWSSRDHSSQDHSFGLVRPASEIVAVPAPSSLACLIGVGLLVGLNEWRKKRRLERRAKIMA